LKTYVAEVTAGAPHFASSPERAAVSCASRLPRRLDSADDEEDAAASSCTLLGAGAPDA
jgi:hypothetical protein